ncbi:ABC transporter ATP-binding protein [Saccharococcus thermophilus]|uniref:ABC-2 type transport system ATP-binding protein n=1 Tax=Saccharococcus thermophilus TaxID=29396 RepID=A0A846MCQ8_9BACL|nr:ABC transporter ATP-binding protein [Saccharococcus thermophilus]NIK14678.1 ABC-2 type transport system ATP-binding protein [Saccharococcus thermophilus]
METVLDVKHLKKAYGKKQALKDVTFTVPKGTCLGLLGPNGAGKSTTMKILAGIIEADSGTATILGMDSVKQRHAIRRLVGYVPQAITLYEQLSAYDNLVFFGEMYGVRGTKLKQRIAEVLEQTGLTERAKDAVNTFSGGMKRRVNIAAALLHQPQLLILDEPTVGIDPQSRNHIFEMIRSLLGEGVTIIYSTHYMEEVEILCNSVAIIDNGVVLTQEPLKELLDRYSHKAIYVEGKGLEKIVNIPDAAKTYRKGSGWVIETNHVMFAVKEVLQKAENQGIEIKELEISRPTLESVFLSLTGTNLRD